MTQLPVSGLTHRTVLLNEAIHALDIQPHRCNGVYVDGTFGRGGHSRLLLSQLGPSARLLAFDRDPTAIAEAAGISDPRFDIVHDNFSTLEEALDARGIAQVDGILLDLGISSPQVDDPERGFSFRADGPLDMRMDTTRGQSAAEWLATVDEKILGKVIREYGEERFAVSIAKAIVAGRMLKPISGTRQLAQLVASAVKTREKGKDPATRTFQAIRIFINQELEALEIGLETAFRRMAPRGRLVVISFHSLEDRIVKQQIAAHTTAVQLSRRLPIRAVDIPRPEWQRIERVKPSEQEVTDNPRARSAIMRVAERSPVPEASGKYSS